MDKLFTPFSKVKYINKTFDFTISPTKFIDWLRIEDECFEELEYSKMVASMCEFSCLYISMLLYDKDLKGQMYVCSAQFGFWEHFWIAYEVDNKEYIIDLTLQQFIKDSPQLAISIKKDDELGYAHKYLDKTPIKEYVDSRKAFEFYTNPYTLKPKDKFDFHTDLNIFDEMESSLNDFLL